MDGRAVSLVLLSVVFMAGHSVIRKWLFNKNVISESELLTIQCGIGAIVCGIWAFSLAEWEELAPLHPNTTLYVLGIVGTIIANIIVQFASTRATRLSDLSFTAPISAMTPGFVAVTAIVFGEFPSSRGWLGITLIVIGAYLHTREGSTLKEYLLPLFIWTLFGKDDHLSEAERNKRRALRWAYGGAICSTFGLICDGLLSRHGNIAVGVTIELMALTLVFAVLHKMNVGNVLPEGFTERVRKHWLAITSLGICFGLPFVLLGIALRVAPVSYVGAGKRVSIVVTLLFAWWVLKEMQKSKRRLLTGGMIAGGAFILALDPTPAVFESGISTYLTRIIGL